MSSCEEGLRANGVSAKIPYSCKREDKYYKDVSPAASCPQANEQTRVDGGRDLRSSGHCVHTAPSIASRSDRSASRYPSRSSGCICVGAARQERSVSEVPYESGFDFKLV
jgi:hypothetical protein